MVKKGVKAIFSDDKSTVTTYAYPSKGGYKYKLTKKTWKNECPFCKAKGKTSRLKWNPKKVAEGELTCSSCDADFCAVSGKDKASKVRKVLTPATAVANKATKVATSQTKSQTCNLTKAEALTKSKKSLKTSSTYKGKLEIPIIPNIHLGDAVSINFSNELKGTYYISSIKEDISKQTYSMDLVKTKPSTTNKYDGSYILKTKSGALLNSSDGNPLQAKCNTVNINIGLKGDSAISKKIMLKGQKLGTVDKIYKWLRIKSGGGTGGWKYKKYGNHIVSKEDCNKFGPQSAEKCWKTKTANCCDFSWIMSMMGKGAGKKIGIKQGTYKNTNGKSGAHMWNYSGTKYYDCSSNTTRTIDWKKVEKVK